MQNNDQSQSEKITNLDFLNGFCKGDSERIKKYISIYLKSTPANLEKINTAKLNEDFEALKLTVHSMKPHLNFMGMTKAAECVGKIETLASANIASPELDELLASLIHDCQHSVEELNLSLQTI